MRIASYARVSTFQQVAAQTIDQQLTRLQAYANDQRWEWSQEYIFRDDGYSGAVLQRPGLDRLRDEVAAVSFDKLLIAAPDRLARKYVHQMLLIEEFEKGGCEVVFVDHPMTKDPNDQLLLQIRGAVAEYERTLIVERMRRGRQHKYRTGQLLPWTQTLYGYSTNPDQPRCPDGVRLNDEHAAVVVEIYARYLTEGQTLSSVAKHLTATGIPTPSGKPIWRIQSVRSLLTNPTYTGKVYAGRTRVRPSRRKRSPLAPTGRRRNGKQATPPEEWIFVCDIPAIVSAELFDQVQVKLRQNQSHASRNNKKHDYLLRARVSCGLCHYACQGQTRRRYKYYRCAGHYHQTQNGLETPCPSRLIPARQLDDIVWQDIAEILAHPDIIAQSLQRAQNGAWLPQELQARRTNLQRGVRSMQNQIERLTEAYLCGIMELREYQRRRQDLEGRIQALEQQQREIMTQVDRQHEITQWVRSIENFCQHIQVGLAQANFNEKRRIVELLIDRVVVTNEDVEIRYVIPTTPKSENIRFYQLRTDYC